MSLLSDTLTSMVALVAAAQAGISASNVRTLSCTDLGSPNQVVVEPVPAVRTLGNDIVLIVDVDAPNTQSACTLAIAGFDPMPIKWSDGQALSVGDLQGTVILRVNGVGTTNGPYAQLMTIGAAALASHVVVIGGGGGGGGSYLTAVAHDASLSGDGTVSSPLGVVPTGSISTWPIGSYVFAGAPSLTSASVGQTVAGSVLAVHQLSGGYLSDYTGVPGTWEYLGYCPLAYTGGNDINGLWRRVA